MVAGSPAFPAEDGQEVYGYTIDGDVPTMRGLNQARPARITSRLTSADGTPVTRKLRVKDQPGRQTFDLRGSEVVRPGLITDTTYGAGKDRRLAVAEVEFFGRRP
ncbi:hypothetical protein ACFWOJ_27495 [Streptomyces sp. NPDC058439]|uniref:hypothetical protein n=1 Tax=Streptomyces sp. NPDC058439 TaxID=3346500 RepID=UPI00365A3E31